jgi:hypothetical protein
MLSAMENILIRKYENMPLVDLVYFYCNLIFIVVYDALTGATSGLTSEYCAKYGFLASPVCGE